MALIVEDGSIVSGADSYTSLANARTIAEKYGYTLPADDTKANVSLRKGAWYVDSFESKYPGSRTSDDQSLAWPREDAAYCYGASIDSDSIPSKMQLGQVIAAATYGAGVDVNPNDNGLSIASHAVSGAVSQSYFNNGNTSEQVTITEAVSALECLFDSSASNKFSFKVSRA